MSLRRTRPYRPVVNTRLERAFTAYVDESGTDEGNRFIVLGGLLSDGKRWMAFSRRWKKILKKADVPYSHMREFAHNSGAFRKWHSLNKQFEPQRHDLMKQLCDAIVDCAVYGFGFIMSKNDYEKHVPENIKQTMGEPYVFLARWCFVVLGRWAVNNDHNNPINIVFERGQPQSDIRRDHRIVLQHEQARRYFRIGSLVFGDKYNRKLSDKSVLPLQGADIVAYELLKHKKNMATERHGSVRYPLKQLNEIPHEWLRIGVPDIKEVVRTWEHYGPVAPKR